VRKSTTNEGSTDGRVATLNPERCQCLGPAERPIPSRLLSTILAVRVPRAMGEPLILTSFTYSILHGQNDARSTFTLDVTSTMTLLLCWNRYCSAGGFGEAHEGSEL
jgi:hypothetical protein